MIYQLNGKKVKNKPIGTFTKIVVIPGKLKNYITQVLNPDNISFWLGKNYLHVNKKMELYINGKRVV